MKTWNIPELQELDVRLTASGEAESTVEEEPTTEAETESFTTFSMNNSHHSGGSHPHRHNSGCIPGGGGKEESEIGSYCLNNFPIDKDNKDFAS